MVSKYFAHSPIVVLGALGSTSYTRSIGCLSHTTLQVLQLYYFAIFKVACDIATKTYCHRVLTGGRTSLL